MKAHHSRGTGWVVIQLSIFAAQFSSVLFQRNQWPEWISRMAGATLLTAGTVCGLPGVLSLGRNLTPLPEPKASGQLVTTGIYSYIRHPLYAGLMAIGLGWALLWRSWPALLLAVVQAVFLRAKARHEEDLLRARFPDYAAYAERVPRFLPHLRASGRETANS